MYRHQAALGTCFPPSSYEQAEPGFVRAASRTGVPGSLQGTGRLQGGPYRGNQGEPRPVALSQKRPSTSGFCLDLEAGQ